MRFIECVHGRYRIYAGALAVPLGNSGFVATLVIKILSEDGVNEIEAFRDLALTNDMVWADEGDAVQYAVRKGHYVIAARPHSLAKARESALSSFGVGGWCVARANSTAISSAALDQSQPFAGTSELLGTADLRAVTHGHDPG